MMGETASLICYLCSLKCSYPSAKTVEREGIISSSSFCGRLADYYSHVFSLIHTLPLDEFFFKEMRMWGQYKISSCFFCVWCKSRELGGRGSPGFATPWWKASLCRRSTSYKKLLGRVAFGIIYIASTKSRNTRGESHQLAFMDSCLTINRTRLACLSSR